MGGQVGACERAPQSIAEEERKGLEGCVGQGFLEWKKRAAKKIVKWFLGLSSCTGPVAPTKKS